MTSTVAVKPEFEIENDEVKMVQNTKYLGVNVDPQFKWTSIFRGVGILRYWTKNVPVSTVKQC